MEEKIELFTKYVHTYDFENPMISLKYDHTLRVMKLCEEISKSLNLSSEDIKLSQTIGLLHDIARFHQCTEYQTFDDSKSIDHGDYALKIIERDELIQEIVKDIDKQVLEIAIKYHNKYGYDTSLTDRTILFCKIIRDADKLDILNLYIEKRIKEVYDSKITDKIYNDIMNHRQISHKDVKTKLDRAITRIGFIFDINFVYSINYILDNSIIDTTINILIKNNKEEKIKLEQIKKETLEYLKERVMVC